MIDFSDLVLQVANTTTATIIPVTTQQSPTDQFNEFLLSLTAIGAPAAGGIGALWAKFRSKAQRIDNALRAQDFDTRDLMELWNSIIIAGKKNPDMPFGQIIQQKAYKDRDLSDTTIIQAWDKEYLEYDEWFTKRYVMNPD